VVIFEEEKEEHFVRLACDLMDFRLISQLYNLSNLSYSDKC